MCHYGGDQLWGRLQSPPRAPGQPPGVWVQGQDQGRVWGRPRAGGLDSLDPHLKAAPSPPQARSRAAQSPNSFNCFSNLKIKQAQRHLQGGAGFRLGLCSQGWGASQGLSAPALGADPSSLRAPFSSVPLPVCLREPTTGSPTSVHRGLPPPPLAPGPHSLVLAPRWHWDPIPGSSPPQRPLSTAWGRAGVGEGRAGTSPCPRRESWAAELWRAAWAAGPGCGQAAPARHLPASPMATGPGARARGGATEHAICHPHLLLPEDRCRHPPWSPRGSVWP